MKDKYDEQYFSCACSAMEHTVRLTYYDDDFFLEIFLDNGTFWNRLVNGIKYIFGFKSKYGHFGSWLLRREDVGRLKEMLEKYLEDSEVARNHLKNS